MASGPMTWWQMEGGESGINDPFYFLDLQNHFRHWLWPWNEKTPAPWKENYDKAKQHIKKQRHHFANKGPYSQRYGFPSSHIWMGELVHKEGWAPKNGCFPIKTLESSLDCKKSNQSILKEINPECSLEGLMLKLQYSGHLMRRADSLEKTLMTGK